MKWKNLKSFAIAMLILLNTVAGILVYIRYTEENYYDRETIENMTALLDESDIVLAPQALSEKITRLYVLAGAYSEEKTAQALTGISGAAPVYDGEKYVCHVGNSVYTHDGMREFSYMRTDIPAPDATGAVSPANAARESENARRAVKEFLHFGELFPTGGKYKADLVCREILYSPSGGFFAARLYLEIAGAYTDNEIVAYLRGDTVIGISGKLPFAFPSESIKAQETGILTALLSEKAFIDSQRAAGTAKGILVLSHISYSYITWFDMKNTVYFTPVCELHYTNGDCSRYDMITGERL